MDYAAVNVNVTMEMTTMEMTSHSTLMNFSVQLTADVIDEETEYFTLRLALLSNELAGRVVLQPNIAIVTIQDDDGG